MEASSHPPPMRFTTSAFTTKTATTTTILTTAMTKRGLLLRSCYLSFNPSWPSSTTKTTTNKKLLVKSCYLLLNPSRLSSSSTHQTFNIRLWLICQNHPLITVGLVILMQSKRMLIKRISWSKFSIIHKWVIFTCSIWMFSRFQGGK